MTHSTRTCMWLAITSTTKINFSHDLRLIVELNTHDIHADKYIRQDKVVRWVKHSHRAWGKQRLPRTRSTKMSLFLFTLNLQYKHNSSMPDSQLQSEFNWTPEKKKVKQFCSFNSSWKTQNFVVEVNGVDMTFSGGLLPGVDCEVKAECTHCQIFFLFYMVVMIRCGSISKVSTMLQNGCQHPQNKQLRWTS